MEYSINYRDFADVSALDAKQLDVNCFSEVSL